MKNPNHPFTFHYVLLYLALLFSLFILAACVAEQGLMTQILPTTAHPTPHVELVDNPIPEVGYSGTGTPDAGVAFDCNFVGQIPLEECKALVALYNSTHGPEWADNHGWLATDDPCTWSGIECTDYHISHISLSYNQLSGTMPPELGVLSHLHLLALGGNQLYGPIPAELGDLSDLVTLNLSSNQLSGHLPAALGNLAELEDLVLAFNQLSGTIPRSLGKMGSLLTLNLSNNQFNGTIPVELGRLSNLTQLYLSHNQLSGTIPVEMVKLEELYELDLSYNQLGGSVPPYFARIEQHMLWGNQFEGTLSTSGQEPLIVEYKGVRFTVDPSLASSVWPEVIQATPLPEVLEGPSYWLATPEHIRFTFADPDLSPTRRRMGFNLAAEAQILVFPLADLVDMNELVQAQIEILRKLLAERRTVPAGELPLVPLTNAAQVSHAQAQYLEFGDIQGLRYLTQHSQDPRPVMLSQELFYTFQGITSDGAYYVAAFFPLTTTALPDKFTEVDWTAIRETDASYTAYLSETVTILDHLPPTKFTPDVSRLDAVVTSLRLEPAALPFEEAHTRLLVARK